MNLQLVECPRDAMQGIRRPIPLDLKVKYVNLLLKVGFHSLDFGSFVSPKAIPQMADTAELVQKLETEHSPTRLLAIVLNSRGALEASRFDKIHYLGYPFSVSETFQQRNANSSIAGSLERLKKICDIAGRHDKEVVVYLSMAFGNPYGDPWSAEIVARWAEEMQKLGIKIISLADTVGMATPAEVRSLFGQIIPAFPDQVIGAHLHSAPARRREKLEAAWDAGCRRFDGALRGYGGCPMAEDELVGNMASEEIIAFLEEKGMDTGIRQEALHEAMALANEIFTNYQ